MDSFRPLDAVVVEEMKKYYDVTFTYNSNAIEGNTLTQSETEIVLEKGITIHGKSLKKHLEVVGHKEAIDYIEELSGKEKLRKFIILSCGGQISARQADIASWM